MSRRLQRIVLHLDMDAFYAAVEVRENPRLAGQPLIVGHRGPRGVVSTCSYEARKFGVRSAMPSTVAERLCPQATWIAGRMPLYAEVSESILGILDRFSPSVEPLSIDEAFLDLTGIARDLEASRPIAAEIKAAIRAKERLSASIGVAPNKFLAKLASDLEKPDGLVLLPAERIPDRLWPLPVERSWGVGPHTTRRLNDAGIRTIGQFLTVEERDLAALVGRPFAAHLRALARGEDDRPVNAERGPGSVSEERTYARDLTNADDVDRELLARAEGVARQLRRLGLAARTVRLKVRAADYTTWTRTITLAAPTDLTETILRAARGLLGGGLPLAGRGIRLLGIGASGLDRSGQQRTLFADPREERARRVARATDAVCLRLGEGALTRARLIR